MSLHTVHPALSKPFHGASNSGLLKQRREATQHACSCSRRVIMGAEQGKGRKDKQAKKDKMEAYDVVQVDPPPKPLGTHLFPKNTQCGEMLEVEDQQFMVSTVKYKYKLERGKYRRQNRQLDVQATGRYILNVFLDKLYSKDGGD
eukprot:CAMPEP_0197849454 /NCGR_PEP_ID=MMETSP1438-20131217/12146_1 /TAXON_ID=1461541 /ORGANISM="Pterosperma sp., Strain CCMP1384" /LENGTH=144 /DNA_ID=CAMNT_0043462149 /DNA_START=81 /DNA_END=512 /DNA_ORIENTATION=-